MPLCLAMSLLAVLDQSKGECSLLLFFLFFLFVEQVPPVLSHVVPVGR